MADMILGFNANTFYGVLLLLLLIILGIVSFHYFVYIKGGNGGLRAGTGVGVAILPGRMAPEDRFPAFMPNGQM